MLIPDLCSNCGSVPEIANVGDWKKYYICRCPKCGWTSAKTNEASTTIHGAIKIWNKGCRNV